MAFYAKTIRGTRYRRWKNVDNYKTLPGPHGPWKKTLYGRVHVQFYDREMKAWRFICGKMDNNGAFEGARGDPLDEPDAQVTCMRCLKHTEVIEVLDGEVPDLMDFQD